MTKKMTVLSQQAVTSSINEQLMVFMHNKEWYFEDDENYSHGPFSTQQAAIDAYRKHLENLYDRSYEDMAVSTDK